MKKALTAQSRSLDLAPGNAVIGEEAVHSHLVPGIIEDEQHAAGQRHQGAALRAEDGLRGRCPFAARL